MQKKISYLFGAGASCNALPILTDMARRMEDQIEYLNTQPDSFDSAVSEEAKNIDHIDISGYTSDLKWLIGNCDKHASIDTFARKLYLTGERKGLITLKNCLSAFFIIEQHRTSVDARYDAFFASLLLSKFDMPKDLKIISWNYDMQFELAYLPYCEEDNLYNVQPTLGVCLKHNDNWRNTDRFGIFKLNGSSIAYSSDPLRNPIRYSNPNAKIPAADVIKNTIKTYYQIKATPADYILGISFAWEQENQFSSRQDIVTITKDATQETEVLVIVGYSIPFFNRKIDRDIITNMKKLEKVYFQTPDADALIERFYSIRNDIRADNLIAKHNCDQFYLPNEL